MKKWQKVQAREGKRGFEDLIHEESSYRAFKPEKYKKKNSIRDRHSNGSTKRYIVIDRSSNMDEE